MQSSPSFSGLMLLTILIYSSVLHGQHPSSTCWSTCCVPWHRWPLHLWYPCNRTGGYGHHSMAAILPPLSYCASLPFIWGGENVNSFHTWRIHPHSGDGHWSCVFSTLFDMVSQGQRWRQRQEWGWPRNASGSFRALPLFASACWSPHHCHQYRRQVCWCQGWSSAWAKPLGKQLPWWVVLYDITIS